jgi:hypothetical protein
MDTSFMAVTGTSACNMALIYVAFPMPMRFEIRTISSQQSDSALLQSNYCSVSLQNCQPQSMLEPGEKSASTAL